MVEDDVWRDEFTAGIYESQTLALVAAKSGQWDAFLERVSDAAKFQLDSIQAEAWSKWCSVDRADKTERSFQEFCVDGTLLCCADALSSVTRLTSENAFHAAAISAVQAYFMLAALVERFPRVAHQMLDCCLSAAKSLRKLDALRTAEGLVDEALCISDRAIDFQGYPNGGNIQLLLRVRLKLGLSSAEFKMDRSDLDGALAAVKGVELMLDDLERSETQREFARDLNEIKVLALRSALLREQIHGYRAETFWHGRAPMRERELALARLASAEALSLGRQLELPNLMLAEFHAKRAGILSMSDSSLWPEAEENALEALARLSGEDSGSATVRTIRVDSLTTLVAVGSRSAAITDEDLVLEAKDLQDGTVEKEHLLFVARANLGLNASQNHRTKHLDEAIELGRQHIVRFPSGRKALIDLLKIRANLHLLGGEAEVALPLLREGLNLQGSQKSFEDPLLSIEENQDVGVSNLLVAGMALVHPPTPVAESLETSESLRTPGLGDLAWLGLQRARDPDSEMAHYSKAVSELAASSAARLLSEDGSYEGKYQEALARCHEMAQELTASGVQTRAPRLLASDIRDIATKSQRVIIDLRTTSLGTVAHAVGKDILARRLIKDATTERINDLLNKRAGDMDGGWFYYMDQSQGRIGKDIPPASRQHAWNRATSALLEEVQQLVMNELQGLVESVPRDATICFIVSGPLGSLPLHACRWVGDPATQTWLDRFSVTYSPSSSILQNAWNWTRAVYPDIDRERIAVVASPVLPEGFRRLPFSCLEAAGIDNVFRHGSGVYCGEEARLKRAIAKSLPERLHLATHAIADQQFRMFTRLVLSEETLYAAGLLSVGWGSMRHCTVSACDSGLVDIGSRSGDSLTFPTLLMVSGVPRVWSTMWHVDDVSTALLMMKSYEWLQAGASEHEALRKSQLWLRDSSGPQLFEIAVRAFDHLASDPLKFGCSKESIDAIRTRLGSLRRQSQPFENPTYWAAVQHVGI